MKESGRERRVGIGYCWREIWLGLYTEQWRVGYGLISHGCFGV